MHKTTSFLPKRRVLYRVCNTYCCIATGTRAAQNNCCPQVLYFSVQILYMTLHFAVNGISTVKFGVKILYMTVHVVVNVISPVKFGVKILYMTLHVVVDVISPVKLCFKMSFYKLDLIVHESLELANSCHQGLMV